MRGPCGTCGICEEVRAPNCDALLVRAGMNTPPPEVKPTPPPEAMGPRIGRKFVTLADGDRFRVKSPTFKKALQETGVSMAQLRGEVADLPSVPVIEGPQPPEVMERRKKAFEDLRLENFAIVLAARNRHKARAQEMLKEQQGRETERLVSDDEAPQVAAAVAAAQQRMEAQLNAEMARMQRAEEMALEEARQIEGAAAEQHRLMIELEKSKAEKARRAKRNRERTEQRRQARERRLKAQEQQALDEQHEAQRYVEEYDNRFESEWSKRQQEIFGLKLEKNRKHLARLHERQQRQSVSKSTVAQNQLREEAKNEAMLQAHIKRVEKRNQRVVNSARQRSEVVEAKHRAALEQKKRTEEEMRRREEQHSKEFERRVQEFEQAKKLAYEEAKGAGKTKGQNQQRNKMLADQLVKQRQQEGLAQIDGKIKKMDQIAQVRDTALALRAEESRLKRIKREAEILRLKRIKAGNVNQRLHAIEARDAKESADKRAKETIAKKRAEMAKAFLFKKKQLRAKAMVGVVP